MKNPACKKAWPKKKLLWSEYLLRIKICRIVLWWNSSIKYRPIHFFVTFFNKCLRTIKVTIYLLSTVHSNYWSYVSKHYFILRHEAIVGIMPTCQVIRNSIYKIVTRVLTMRRLKGLHHSTGRVFLPLPSKPGKRQWSNRRRRRNIRCKTYNKVHYNLKKNVSPVPILRLFSSSENTRRNILAQIKAGWGRQMKVKDVCKWKSKRKSYGWSRGMLKIKNIRRNERGGGEWRSL